MTTTLLMVRHTNVHNPEDILYGRLPRYRLSDLGLKQAEATAAALAEEPVTAIYTSPRLRARQTARFIAAAHPDAGFHTTRLLDEVLTSWQGRPHSALEMIGFDFYSNPLDPSDERLEAIWARIQKFVARVRKRHPGESVVGVSHGDPTMLARALYLRNPLEVPSLRRPHIYPGHGSITRFTFPADLQETYPLSVEYYDPNAASQGIDGPWAHGWTKMRAED